MHPIHTCSSISSNLSPIIQPVIPQILYPHRIFHHVTFAIPFRTNTTKYTYPILLQLLSHVFVLPRRLPIRNSCSDRPDPARTQVYRVRKNLHKISTKMLDFFRLDVVVCWWKTLECYCSDGCGVGGLEIKVSANCLCEYNSLVRPPVCVLA